TVSFLVFYGGSIVTSEIYFSLVVHSNINFNVIDILNLDYYSGIGILVLGTSLVAFMFLVGIFVHIAKRIVPTQNVLLKYELIILSTIAVLLILLRVFDVNYFLLSAILILATWHGFSKEKYDLAVLISVLLLLATVSSLKHNEFQKIKRQEAQKMTL